MMREGGRVKIFHLLVQSKLGLDQVKPETPSVYHMSSRDTFCYLNHHLLFARMHINNNNNNKTWIRTRGGIPSRAR